MRQATFRLLLFDLQSAGKANGTQSRSVVAGVAAVGAFFELAALRGREALLFLLFDLLGGFFVRVSDDRLLGTGFYENEHSTRWATRIADCYPYRVEAEQRGPRGGT